MKDHCATHGCPGHHANHDTVRRILTNDLPKVLTVADFPDTAEHAEAGLMLFAYCCLHHGATPESLLHLVTHIIERHVTTMQQDAAAVKH